MLARSKLRLSSAEARAKLILGGHVRGLLTTSFARGLTELPLLEVTIPEHFASVVSQYGDQDAVVSRPQGRLTYSQLDQKSNAIARTLQQLGVKKGDRVAVSLGNNLEFGATTYALFKLGAILVPLNPAFNSTQVISALSHLSATHLIIGAETNVAYKPPRENVTLLKSIAPNLESSARLESASVPSLQQILIVDNSSSRIDVSKYKSTFNFSQAWNSPDYRAVTPSSPLDVHDTINIQFTSGTTAMPKAACLSHRAILNNGNSIGGRMGLTPSDVVVCPPPLFHCFGCILGYMATATHGSSIVFPAEAFNPLATLQAVQEEKATALYGVATMFAAELELLSQGKLKREGFQNLRTGIAAGSSVPSRLMSKLHEELNLTGLTICYGMTETSPVSLMTSPDDPMDKRLDSVGRLMPHVNCKVVSETEPRRILPIGEKGELVVSGYSLMSGYWGDKLRTEEVMKVEVSPDGKEEMWMYTGDEAEMGADGYVKITGRIKDLIIRGGENIHPLEVENVLFGHPAVVEASVVGLPDEKYGECVAAFVIVHEDVATDESGHGLPGGKNVSKDDLRQWVREKLSPHLVPKYVFWTDSYPKTPSGKIQKFRLREEGIKLRKEGKRL